LVRRARPGDALAIRKLLRELGYGTSDARASDETIAQVVRHPEAAVFAAVEGVEVVGYVALSHRPQMRLGGRLASVDELVVTAARRGTGVGSALLDAAIAHARSLHCVRLEVNQRRTRESYERRFYQERGFEEVDSAVLRLELI
jgi:N-acetylglutamate synthase-like GNAT family acetyltransferase